MSLSKLQRSCICGNDKDDRFWVLRSPDNDENLWGICCRNRKCQTEFLIADFCQDEVDNKDPHQVRWDGVELFKKDPVRPLNNHGFQASLKRIRVKKIKYLEEGDQITWSRRYFIWHHGVVTKVNESNFEVVHWAAVSKSRMKIVKVVLTEGDLERAFRIDYSEVLGHADGRKLVVSRAYSRLHLENEKLPVVKLCKITGEYDDDFALINANCEHFATYCTLGSGVCFQTRYAHRVTARALDANTVGNGAKMAAIAASEVIENSAHTSEIVGASAIVLIEGVHFIADYTTLRKLFKNGSISRKVYTEEIIKHLTGSVTGITLGVAGGALGTPALQMILAPLLTVSGKFVGMQIGSEMGLAITDKWMDIDEKVVSTVNDLNPGDHIVRTKLGGISRTHGIFVRISSREGFIVVILFEKKRIVKLESEFSGIRRVMYNATDELADPDDVISAAESLVADPAPRVKSRKRQVISCKLK